VKHDQVVVSGMTLDVWSCNTVVVGSGAAGFNAADCLYNLGQPDVAILTEGVNMGTSRNTGSDKQTYYKITLAGDVGDSVQEMAQTLFSGGSRHGDLALVEAALSARCFFKLVDIGVDFPHNRYGEYVGYKTDHDPRQRATSVGPLTSKIMTEKLEQQVRCKQIKIFDRFLVIGMLTDQCGRERKTIGLVALDTTRLAEPCRGITLFNCTNIVYATGGPAGMYLASVYPESQTGGAGAAFAAGARGINLTESQFGIASTKFRWNLSGTYQQVIPRYISTDQNGRDEREFLDDYFPSLNLMLTAIFLKGYQWPFDPRKIANHGSSLIDVLVYNETAVKGRRVFLDYTRNPGRAEKDSQFDSGLLSGEAFAYLEKSDALFGTPIDRLKHMNMPAVDLYKNKGIDLATEPLEIAICAQHNNGGLLGDIWWESNLRHLFPVGEVNGSFGVYRPGGSALNSTQVGSLRAAQCIAARYRQEPLALADFVQKAEGQAAGKIQLAWRLARQNSGEPNLQQKIQALRTRMTLAGGHIRCLDNIEQARLECRQELRKFSADLILRDESELADAFRFYDMLLTQFVYLSALGEYARKGGQSRGSYLVYDPKGDLPTDELPELFRYSLDNGELMNWACEVELLAREDWECNYDWLKVRPVPSEDNWFEKTWEEFRQGAVYK